MIFRPGQIQNVLKQISKNILLYISMNLGEAVLSEADHSLLSSMGLSMKNLSGDFPPYYKMFLLGRLTQLIGEWNSSRLEYPEFEDYLRRGQFQPLTPFEEIQYTLARQATYSHLKNLENRARMESEGIMMDVLSRSEYEAIVKEEIEVGIKERKAVGGIVSDIGHRTLDWKKDIGRIVDTEMNNIFQRGRAVQISEKNHGTDPLVYKDVYEGACRHCIYLYLTHGIGSAPRVFHMSELLANGSNIGRKVPEWKATIGGVHPFCFLNPNVKIYTTNGWISISKIQPGDMVLTHKGRFRKVTSTMRRKYQVGITEIYNIKIRVRGGKVSLNGITGSHPILTNRGWIKVVDLQKTDKISFGTQKCTECQVDFPIYTNGGSICTISAKVCSHYCGGKSNATVFNKKLKDPEYKAKYGKEMSERLIQMYKERPEIVEQMKETKKLKHFNMTFEERCALTKNANVFVREQISKGTFNFSQEFIHSRSGKRTSTGLEGKMKWLLQKLNIEFIEQFEIVRNEWHSLGRKRRYYVDFYIPKHNLVIECDGYYHHSDEHKAYDIERDLEIKKLIGAEVVHFTDKEIQQNLGDCFVKMNRVLANHEGKYSGDCTGEILSIEKRSGSQLNGYFRYNKEKVLYNFAVDEDESYIADGIVVHNCRCNLRELPAGMIWNKDKKQFVYNEKSLKEQEAALGMKGKIKIYIGNKLVEV
jgi:very-short-patch-repair endonuclease